MGPIIDLIWSVEEDKITPLSTPSDDIEDGGGGGGGGCGGCGACIACCCSVPSIITKWLCN